MAEDTGETKEKFIHRDISWLAFNERVLEAGCCDKYPLLERLKFMAIFANNMDEFFMVRVAGLKRLISAGYNKKDAYGYYPSDLLAEVQATVERLIKKCDDCYNGFAAKELNEQKISILRFNELNQEQKKYVNKFFETNIFPIVTPMAVDQGHPFPVLPSKTIAIGVSLTRYDKPYLSVIPIPKNISRLLKLPSEANEANFIFIEEMLRSNIEDFFRGFKISSVCTFRVIRDSELAADEEYSQDLLKAIEEEIKKRPRARLVRLEIEKEAENQLIEPLCQGLDFPMPDITFSKGPLDITYLFELISQANKPKLNFPVFIPAKVEYENIFDRIKEGDFVVHLPYESFQPTLDLLHQAACDKDVLGIKMTLYRINDDSAFINTLKEAARNKKQVSVLVELKARFEEEKNIRWARDLEDAGCHVIYGMPGLKIHSKMTMVVRREDDKIRRYVHLSTGNYNEKTGAQYTDIGFFTANDDFARDVSDVFNVITGYSVPGRWRRVVSSPNDLRQYFFELVDQEIEYQKKYKNGLIMAKMNSLEDTKMIEKLYEASNAGVKIKLVVRGICCLIPQAKGLSENIKVKSVVARFLEHSRIFIFNNNLQQRVFLSSADWMVRNFDRRIELLFEIYNDRLKEQLRDIVSVYWKDTAASNYLSSDKTYVRPKETGEPFNAQEYLINFYSK